MALIKCKECKNKVSKKAVSCPHCGAPIKNKGTNGCTGCLSVILLGVVGILALTSILPDSTGNKSRAQSKVDDPNTPNKTIKPKSAKEIRVEQIQSCFSPWNGSHRGLVKVTKEGMNDPDSFKHVETVYWDQVDHIRVSMTFRGKNAFGGVVKTTILAKSDLSGNIFEIISQRTH